MRTNTIMAWGTVATAIAAFLGVGITAWYSRQTVEIARKMHQEVITDRNAQQARFDTERGHEVQRANVQRAERVRLERLARLPLLVQYQCCNPVAIVLEHNPNGGRGVRFPNEDEYRLFSPDHNFNHVVRVINLGQGPALRISATWHPEKVKLSNGREIDISDSKAQTAHMRPFNLKTEADGQVRHFPRCFYEDNSATDNRLAHVTGYLSLSCVDNAGERHKFEYNFKMDVFCDARPISDNVTTGAIIIDIEESPREQPSLEPTHEPDVADDPETEPSSGTS